MIFLNPLQRSLTVLFLGLACAALPAVTYATHSWGSYHWARTTPQFTLKLGDNMSTAGWKAHLAGASSDWNSPTLFGALTTPLLTAITAGKSDRNCSMVVGTTQVCNRTYGANGWLGLATINISGVHITRGSAKLNDTYFNTATYNNPNMKLHVMCQEIAHTFGLNHQSTSSASLNTCMDYFSNTGANATNPASTKPNAHDFDQLNSIYNNNIIGGHLDSTTTVAAAVTLAASGVDVTDDSNSWGQRVRHSADGRSSYYERYNADGSMTLTHVYWTEEAAANCPSCDHRYYNHNHDNPGRR